MGCGGCQDIIPISEGCPEEVRKDALAPLRKHTDAGPGRRGSRKGSPRVDVFGAPVGTPGSRLAACRSSGQSAQEGPLQVCGRPGRWRVSQQDFNTEHTKDHEGPRRVSGAAALALRPTGSAPMSYMRPGQLPWTLLIRIHPIQQRPTVSCGAALPCSVDLRVLGVQAWLVCEPSETVESTLAPVPARPISGAGVIRDRQSVASRSAAQRRNKGLMRTCGGCVGRLVGQDDRRGACAMDQPV